MLGSKKGGFQWQNWDFKSGYKPIRWRSKVSAPRCAYCNKAVFPAEEVTAAGQKFHKFCLKCAACDSLLNANNLNEHDKKIYCIPCYRRQLDPRSVGHGFGRTLSFNVDTRSSSPSLNRIETDVDDHYYQRQTSPFRTSFDDDSRPGISQMNSGIYVSGITTQQIHHRPLLANLTPFKMMSVSGNICPRCSKTVYLAEEVKAAGKSFHKRCYNCAYCKGSISGGRHAEHGGELYDDNCYQRLFGLKGIFQQEIKIHY